MKKENMIFMRPIKSGAAASAGFTSALRVFAINNLMKKMNSTTSIIHYVEDT